MSKLIDQLKRLSSVAVRPMGFGATAGKEEKKPLLIAKIGGSFNVDASDYTKAVDAVLLEPSQFKKSEQDDSSSGLIRGCYLGSGKASLKELPASGCDFVVLPLEEAPLTLLDDSEIGRVLAVAISLDEGLIGTLGMLPVDALLVTGGENVGGAMTIEHLVRFKRFVEFQNKVVIASVPLSAGVEELKVLWNAGVNGFVVEVEDEKKVGRLSKLRREINAAEWPVEGRRGKTKALLPSLGNDVEKSRSGAGEV